MGWARTLLLGDIGNRLDIADTEQDISAVRRALADKRRHDANQDATIKRLEMEVEQLELCVVAILTTLERESIISRKEAEYLTRIIEPE